MGVVEAMELDKKVSIKNVLNLVLFLLIGFIAGSFMTMLITYQIISKLI